MTTYRLVLFVHVASMTAMFAALALEWLSLYRLRRAKLREEAREWARIWSLLLPVGLPALIGTLASGIYMATTISAWPLGWVSIAVPALLLVAIAGALVGPRRQRAIAALPTDTGALPENIGEQLRHPALLASLQFRSAVLLGLLFGMTFRPDDAVLPMGIYAAAVLALVSLGLLKHRRRAVSAAG